MRQDNVTREVLGTVFEKSLDSYQGTLCDEDTNAMAAEYLDATQSPEFHEFRQRNELALDEALLRVFVATISTHLEAVDLIKTTGNYLDHVRGEDGAPLSELLLAFHRDAD